MMKNIILLIIMLLIVGCVQKDMSLFSENVRRTEYDKIQKQNLTGKKIIANQIGLGNIEVIGDYLLFSLIKADNKFGLFSKNGEELLSFGRQGYGPNDFINNRLTGQKETDNAGNFYFWVNDVSNSKLKKIRLNESNDSIHFHVEKIIQTLPMSPNSFFINDSLVLSETIEKGIPCVHKYNPKTNRINESIELYRERVAHPFNFYKGIYRFENESQTLYLGMHSINLINTLNINDGNRTSCFIGNSSNLNEIIDKETGIEKWTYYSDLRIKNETVYALYLNQNYKDSYEVPSSVEIHVIKDGNIKRVYYIEEYVLQIAIDESDNYLYGLIGDSAVYRYSLPNI